MWTLKMDAILLLEKSVIVYKLTQRITQRALAISEDGCKKMGYFSV